MLEPGRPDALSYGAARPPSVSLPLRPPMADQIDYRILGDDLQAVVITLDPGEAVMAEAGAMMYMREGIEMATTMDPGGQGGGLFSKLLQGGKRLLAGEGFFVTMFANHGRGRSDVAFAAPTPGRIVPIDLSPSTRSSAPASSAARGSSCSASRATGSRSCTRRGRW